MATGSAGRDLKLARRLDEAPATGAAFAAGEIGYDKAALLTAPLDDEATDVVREAFADSEEALVDAAKELRAHDLRWLMRHWAANADPEGHQQRYNEQYRNRRFQLSETFEGWWHAEGLLDPEGGAILKRALDALSDRLFRDDRTGTDDAETDERRSKAQRDADSLVEMGATVGADLAADRETPDDDTDGGSNHEHEPDGAARPTSASARRGVRPTLAIIADLERLGADPTGVATLFRQPHPASAGRPRAEPVRLRRGPDALLRGQRAARRGAGHPPAPGLGPAGPGRPRRRLRVPRL
ncbi:MAG: DUF222 domain-containing protein [Acidimicrobiia bacterium]|nr:DUF222 domain-containing protein [Acidimicrobiia bacterium]